MIPNKEILMTSQEGPLLQWVPQKINPAQSYLISRVVRSAAVKLADRKFFTVKEDSVILVYLKEHRDSMTSRAIAQKLSKKLKHSLESIRDRIKRFLSKLRLVDEMCIADEAKVILLSPLFFSWIHLTNRSILNFMYTLTRKLTRRAVQ